MFQVFDKFELVCRDLSTNETFPNSTSFFTVMNKTDLPGAHVDAGIYIICVTSFILVCVTFRTLL